MSKLAAQSLETRFYNTYNSIGCDLLVWWGHMSMWDLLSHQLNNRHTQTSARSEGFLKEGPFPSPIQVQFCLLSFVALQSFNALSQYHPKLSPALATPSMDICILYYVIKDGALTESYNTHWTMNSIEYKLRSTTCQWLMSEVMEICEFTPCCS